MRSRMLAGVVVLVLITLGGACGDDDDGESSQDSVPSTTTETTRASTTAGRDVFVANCATCHGQDAEGGLGPQLAGGGAVRAFPNATDQIAFVEGHTLPPFRERLSQQEIRDVVEYTRSLH
jgi:mono/diheme cytochrome c family protein